MKKNVLTAVALGAIAMLGLAACSPAESPEASPTATPDTTAADTAAIEAVNWSVADDVPGLEFTAPLSVGATVVRHIADGDGEVIKEGMNVSLDYVVFAGASAEQTFSTYDAKTPEVVSLTKGAVLQELYDALVGKKVGATFIYAYPDSTATDGTAAVMAVTATSVSTPLPRATGTAVEPADGLPTVTLAESGAPSISFDGVGDKPTGLVVQTLIEGDGDKVASGSQVTVHYTGWLWDGESFDSSWDSGAAATFGLVTGQLIEGWVQGLEGQTVGSQVLLVIPPDLAYGEAGSGSIPADSTLVFVVDILAAA